VFGSNSSHRTRTRRNGPLRIRRMIRCCVRGLEQVGVWRRSVLPRSSSQGWWGRYCLGAATASELLPRSSKPRFSTNIVNWQSGESNFELTKYR
jgi:hypothetical protein